MTPLENRRLERAVRGALLRKELSESRSAIIAGVVIFLFMPLLWTALLAAVDLSHEIIAGLGTVVLLLGGWLFGSVVGAQSIARDFGRQQGDFLLARPVTTADVLRAKVCVGFGLILGLVLTIGAIEWLLATCVDHPFEDYRGLRLIWLMAAAPSAFAYWVALAGAAFTRQTLSGVMLTGVVLALLVTLPMVTSVAADPLSAVDDSSFYDTPGVWYVFERITAVDYALLLAVGLPCFAVWRLLRPNAGSRAAIPFLFVVGVAALADFAITDARTNFDIAHLTLWAAVVFGTGAVALVFYWLARLACRYELALRLGTKSIAWTIGLTAVLVCTLATAEVGANLPVSDTFWAPEMRNHAAYPGGLADYRVANSIGIGNRRVAVGTLGDAVALYDITDEGKLVRRPPHLSVGAGTTTVARGICGPRPAFNEHDEAYVVSSIQPMRELPSGGYLHVGDTFFSLLRVDWEGESIPGPERVLQRPDEIGAGVLAAAFDAAIEGDTLYVQYNHEQVYGPEINNRFHVNTLAVYDLKGSGPPKLENVLDLKAGTPYTPRSPWRRLRRGADGTLHLAAGFWPPPIDVTDPDSWTDAFKPFAFGDEYDGIQPASQLRIGVGRWAVSSRGRFWIAEFTGEERIYQRGGAWRYARVLADVRPSPWAWLFRSHSPTLVAGRLGQVWEVHDNSAICYDVSEPTRPRKIAHVTSYTIHDAVAGPEYLLLDHGAGFSIVRHPQ